MKRIRVNREPCSQCNIAYIQGIRCHEHGCPEAWRDYLVACFECGCSFKPHYRTQNTCPDCIADQHASLEGAEQ